MNPKRIASLLRELADAFEDSEKPKRRKRAITEPDTEASAELVDEVRRKLRSKGVAA